MEDSVHVYSYSNNSNDSFNLSNPLKILLLGYGKSSKAVEEYFQNKNAVISILLLEDKASYRRFYKELNTYDICFRSPGIAINKPVYTLCNLLSKELTNELMYAIKLLNNCFKIVVTGSNGKTSLCYLLYEILTVFNNTHYYGNVGKTLINNLNKINENDYLIVEVSSFQLENIDSNVDIGIIKNLNPNHLNATFNLSTYYASKIRLKLFSLFLIDSSFIKQKSLIYVQNNHIYVNNKIYLNINELDNNTPTYIEDIIICLHVLIYMKLDYEKIKNILIHHKKILHRNNVIKYKNITFVNDGKSSSSSSSKYCFELYKGKRVLILGGIHKSNKFNLKFNTDDEVYIYGKDRYKIKDEIKRGKIYKTLDKVLKNIKLDENDKITIIFSPGCSSFDQYENYNKRSEEFLRWVDKWIK